MQNTGLWWNNAPVHRSDEPAVIRYDINELSPNLKALFDQFYAISKNQVVNHIFDQIRDGYMSKMKYYTKLAAMVAPEIPLVENNTGLPAEIWTTILVGCDYRTIIAAMRTSRLFYHFAKGAIIAWGNEYLSKGPMWKPTQDSPAIGFNFLPEMGVKHVAKFRCSNVEIDFLFKRAETLHNMFVLNCANVRRSRKQKIISVFCENMDFALFDLSIKCGGIFYILNYCCGGFSVTEKGEKKKVCCRHCKCKYRDVTCEELRKMNISPNHVLAPLRTIAPAYIDAIISGACCAANRNRE